MKWSKAMRNYRKLIRLYDRSIRPTTAAAIVSVIIAVEMYTV